MSQPLPRLLNSAQLAEISLHNPLLLGRQPRNHLSEIDVGGLHEGLDRVDDAGCCLALQSLGFEGLGDELEDFDGLAVDGWVLSGGIFY